MIKECKVATDNELNMVILFNGSEIQMPSTKNNDKTVFVKCENNKYSLVDREIYIKSLKPTNKKSAKVDKEIIDSVKESKNEE